jgi:PKD repeat protein
MQAFYFSFSRKIGFLAITLLFFFSCPVHISAQWINANPGAGGQLQHVVCDPNIAGRMYLCSDMEGFYVSNDYGAHWIYKGWESPFSATFNIAVEPGNSSRLYLTSTQGLAITENAGRTWRVVKDFSNMPIATISVNPNDPDMVCLAESWLESVVGRAQGAGKVYFSKNKGETWQSSQFVQYTNNKNVYSINFHPSTSKNDVLVSTDDGIYLTDDLFNSWRKIQPPANAGVCRGCDFTADGLWLYAVYVRKDGKTGVYVKRYPDGEWQEPDPNGHLQQLNQTHWRPKVWPGSGTDSHYVLIGTLNTGGNYNDNALNEGRFMVVGDAVYGHVNQILKVAGDNEPFDVGWNAYWSQCRTYDYYPKSWAGAGYSRGVFAMCQQSAFRGDAARPTEWVVNTCHHAKTLNSTKFYSTNGTASTWVWDISGIENYTVMGMGDNGVAESWDNGISWTQKFAPAFWNIDALEIVKGEKTIVLAGRTDGFGGALFENQGWLYYREVDLTKPTPGWKTAINGKNINELKGLDPYLNRIATIQSDPHKPERVYIGTNDGLYVTENIFGLLNNNKDYDLKNISKPVIGSTLTRRVHVDPNDPDIVYLRCWKGTYRIERKENGNYAFVKLKVNASDQNLNDGWGHNGDIGVWKNDTTTYLMVTRNVSPHWELWLSDDKGETFTMLLNKDKAFALRPPATGAYSGQGPIRYGGLCGLDSMLFASVHLRGGGEELTKGISFLKGTILPDKTVAWEDFTGDPANGGNWFPASRSGKIWKDETGKPAIFQATMGAGMWKRYFDEHPKPSASIITDLVEGETPLTVSFDASCSQPSNGATTIVTYNWDFGDGFKSNEEKVVHLFSQNKSYNAKLTVTDDLGRTATAYTDIRAYKTGPIADFAVSTNQGRTSNEIRFFGGLSFDESKTDSIVSYTWNFGDRATATGKNVSHIFTQSANFYVKLTVTNSKGQSTTVTKPIRIELNTGIGDKTRSNLAQVFPNPVADKLTVSLAQPYSLSIYNSLGQNIFLENDVFGNIDVSTKTWGSGVYIVAVRKLDKTEFRKILKR